MSTYRKQFEGYNLENVKDGPGGTIFYVEGGGRLPFEWGFIQGGVSLTVPTPAQWDPFCERHGLANGKGRRDEILNRVAQFAITWYGSGLLDRLFRRKTEGDVKIGASSLTIYCYSV
jgi:hypothetical protein